jgi:3-oxoacyl-[acyl-carrier protein] reductase
MPNVLVTGASRGLGLAIARRLSAAGYRVLALARSTSDALTAAIEESARRNSAEAMRFVAFDLAQIDAIAAMTKDLRREFGPFFGLVNNAGIGTDGILAMMPDAQIEGLLRINTLAPIILSKYVVRSMLADGGGRIVNMSSIVATTGYKGLSAYAATKASLIGFTRSLAREVGPAGITVNAVAPGFVETSMTHGMEASHRTQIERRSALHRLPEPGDVASAVEFLLSEGAKNITGTVLTVDAGNTA